MNNIPALLWNSNYEKVKYWLGNSSGSTRVIVGFVHRKVQMCFLRDGMSMRNCENRKGRLKRQVGTRDTGPICGVEAEADMTQSVTSLPLGAMDFPDHQNAPCTQTRALSCVCVCVCVCVSFCKDSLWTHDYLKWDDRVFSQLTWLPWRQMAWGSLYQWEFFPVLWKKS